MLSRAFSRRACAPAFCGLLALMAAGLCGCHSAPEASPAASPAAPAAVPVVDAGAPKGSGQAMKGAPLPPGATGKASDTFVK